MSRPVAPNGSRAPQAAPVPVGCRITRRGRLVLLALVAVLAFAVISLGQAALSPEAQAGAQDGSGSDASRTWVVQPNETLWSIAEQVDPDADPRETVARIVSMNDLPDSAVLVGQEIHVPA